MDIKPIDLSTIQTNSDINKTKKEAEKLENTSDDKQLKQACNEFVSILLSQVFKNMDESINRSNLTDEAYGNKWFRQMAIDEYSKAASKQSLQGLADSLYKDIVRSKNR